MTIDESLKQALEPLMPKSLDDIIRSNREKARLYLSTEMGARCFAGTSSACKWQARAPF